MSGFSGLGQPEFSRALQALLPAGRAFPRDPDSVQTAVMDGLADGFHATHQLAVQLLDREADPGQAIDLLTEWETDYGLPDDCAPLGPSLQQRHASLLAKIASSPGGQSAAYYIGVAAQLGYTITITTWRTSALGRMKLGDPMCATPWRFAWRVNAPSITVKYFGLGVSALGDPFWTISDAELECRFDKIQPAYGVLWFQYG